jgi:hypothetical protein
VRCYDDEGFVTVLAHGWQQFKRFVFTYNALLIHAKDFYEKESVNVKLRNNYPYPNVLPVPALALKIFNQLVVDRFQTRLDRVTALLLSKEREREQPCDESLRIILSMFWSVSLRELARMSMSKSGNITFWKETNKHITHNFKVAVNSEDHFRDKILSMLEHHSWRYYTQLYGERLRHLSAIELVMHLERLCKKEERVADYHMPSD